MKVNEFTAEEKEMLLGLVIQAIEEMGWDRDWETLIHLISC